MNPCRLPESTEWAFSSVPAAEVWAALIYEYHREVIRSPDGRFRKIIDVEREFRREMEGDTPVGGRPRVIPELYHKLIAAGCEEWLVPPWLSLPTELREQISGRFPEPETVPPLDIATDWLWVLEGVKDKPEKLAEQMLATRTVLFFLPPNVSRRGLVDRFDAWLKRNPDWTATAPSGREKRKWKPQELLRYLAARRLAKACGGERELLDVAEVAEDVAKELRRPRCAIPGEAELARMIRKANAVIESVVDGRLHEFRVPSAAVIPAPPPT